MKTTGRQAVVIVCSLAILASCAKINLSGGKTGTGSNPAPANNNNNASSGGGMFGNQNPQGPPIPPLDGEWEFDYEFKGQAFVGNVQIAQQGNTLVGEGADQDGRAWTVEAGQIQGNQVSFQKKYGDSPTVVQYTGEIKHEASQEYTGWLMEGKYTATSKDGQPVSGKWVANPTTPLAEVTAAPPPSNPVGLPFQASPPPSQPAASNQNLGDVRPVDISGRYEGTFTYDFKKIKTTMWLRNEGKKISGDGTDIVNKDATRFSIQRGWYEYPKVTIVRKYVKGQGAKESKEMTFKATLSSNGRDISMTGETQAGGAWNAHLVR